MKIGNTFPTESADTKGPFHTILLVDDSAANLGVLVASLESHGYDVLVALDGNEALQRIEVELPDMILLDVMMPGMDGFEVCRKLKAQDCTRDIPVIFMTSLSSGSDKVKGFAAGGVDYIAKPLHIEETLARIRTHLELRDLRRKLEVQNGALQLEVVERKRLESVLVSREREFRTLAENAPDPILRFDRDCRRIYINPAMERLTGTPAAELLNKSPIEAMPVPSANAVQAQQCIRVLETGKPAELEITFTAKDGSERTILNTFVPEFAEDGSVETVLCMGRDMSARKRMEKILLDSEREYRTLAENSPDNILRYDRESRLRYINNNGEVMFALPTSYLMGKTLSEVFFDGLFDELELVMQGVMETRHLVDYDLILPDSGKGERYHRFTLTPEQNSQGEVSGVLVVGRDITEQKRYEQELLARAKLEQQLSALTENIPGFIFTIRVDTNGHTSFPYVSAGIEPLFGLRPQDVRNDAAVLRAKYHPDDLPHIHELMVETERTLAPFRIEIRITNRDNKPSWVEIRSMPQRQPDGVTEWHGMMLDITERKRMDALLQKRESEFRSLAENSPDIIARYDRECHRLYANQAMAALAGKPVDALLGRSPGDGVMLAPEYADKLMAGIREVFAHGKCMNIELVVSRNGNTLEFDALLAPELGTDGAVATVLLRSRDITERKRMENELSESQTRYRQVFDNAQEGMCPA